VSAPNLTESCYESAKSPELFGKSEPEENNFLENLSPADSHGAWSMEHGAWSMEHGAWSMEHGAWSIAHEHGASPMSRATPELLNFARRLIAYEARGNESSETGLPAGFDVCEKLRRHLANLMGTGGYRALLTRALALASAEVAWLRTIVINVDGSLDERPEGGAQVDEQAMAEGGVVLVAQLIGLMMTFIGEGLTLQLLREAWPKLPLNDLDFGAKE
jgi:hypothetical protein